jgi:hypothetical protein
MLWRHVEGVDLYLHSFLTLGLDGGELWTSPSGRLPPKKNHGAYWLGGWVGPNACLDFLTFKNRASYM